MGKNEERTLFALKEARREVTDPKIDEHRGRIVKTTGDGLLVEFASIVDAVRCAVDIQREIKRRILSDRPKTRSFFASGSISATSSSTRPISSATASTSPPGSKGWPTRRDLRQPDRARPGARQTRLWLRGYGPTAGQEHRPAGPCFPHPTRRPGGGGGTGWQTASGSRPTTPAPPRRCGRVVNDNRRRRIDLR